LNIYAFVVLWSVEEMLTIKQLIHYKINNGCYGSTRELLWIWMCNWLKLHQNDPRSDHNHNHTHTHTHNHNHNHNRNRDRDRDPYQSLIGHWPPPASLSSSLCAAGGGSSRVSIARSRDRGVVATSRRAVVYQNRSAASSRRPRLGDVNKQPICRARDRYQWTKSWSILHC
jgi:hypothetical protein